MSTLLTINTNKSETRVIFDQPLRSISEIQLVDYDFPESFEEFKTEQTIKKSDGSNTLLTIKPGNYSFKMMQTVFAHSVSGVDFHISVKGYHLISRNEDVVFSKELSKKLDVISYLPLGKIFSISWPSHKYYVYCNIETSNSVLGQITTIASGNLKPTNLLAIVPSKFLSCQPIPIQVENQPINYLTLFVLDENGNEPNFNDEPFRINLRVVH